jgi:ESF2/ABP1 family protein
MSRLAHEAAQRSAQLRVELAQSRSEQREYLKNVELSRVLDKRAERKKLAAEKTGQPVDTLTVIGKREREGVNSDGQKRKKKPKVPDHSLIDAGAGRESLRGVFDSIF